MAKGWTCDRCGIRSEDSAIQCQGCRLIRGSVVTAGSAGATAPAPLSPGWIAPAPVASRKPLTFANWAKASAVGFLLFAVASFSADAIGATDTSLIALIAWIAGALLACYALELRYRRAYVAVIAGVFLADVIFAVALSAVTG